jgi:hypothetical protein
MEEVEGEKVGFEGEENGGGRGGKERKGARKFGGTRINVRSLNDGKIEGDFRCSILIVMAWKLLLTRDRVGCVTPDQGLHGVVALPFKIGLWRACSVHYDGGLSLSLSPSLSPLFSAAAAAAVHRIFVGFSLLFLFGSFFLLFFSVSKVAFAFCRF